MENTKKQCEKSLEKIEKVVRMKKEEYSKCKDIMECSICMERKVDCVLVPVIYIVRNVSLDLRVCPYCRNPPQKIQKLFFT